MWVFVIFYRIEQQRTATKKSTHNTILVLRQERYLYYAAVTCIFFFIYSFCFVVIFFNVYASTKEKYWRKRNSKNTFTFVNIHFKRRFQTSYAMNSLNDEKINEYTTQSKYIIEIDVYDKKKKKETKSNIKPNRY